MNLKSITRTEKLAYAFLVAIFGLGIYYSNTNLTYFDEVYTKEDGLVEYGTAIMLLCSSLLLFGRFFKFFKHKSISWRIGVFFMALIFFFGTGEEISWGQRIFNIESSQYFIEHNAQGETNLHNMVVDGKKVNKIIFSQLLTIILVLYLLITPILYKKWTWLQKLITMFAVPIVKWHHTSVFLIVTALLVFIPSDRKWELHELAFGVLFFLIFLSPLNKEIYETN